MFELTFEWSFTIENIKDKIHKELSIPRKQQVLLFNDESLDNNKLVTEYEIKNKTVIVLTKDESVSLEEGDMVVKEEEPKLIVWDRTVDPPKEIVISISVEDKLEDMKENIYNINNLSVENQTLIFNEEKLDGTTSVGDLGIKN